MKTNQVRPQRRLLGGESAVEGDRISPLDRQITGTFKTSNTITDRGSVTGYDITSTGVESGEGPPQYKIKYIKIYDITNILKLNL